jgi:hypothetical protein
MAFVRASAPPSGSARDGGATGEGSTTTDSGGRSVKRTIVEQATVRTRGAGGDRPAAAGAPVPEPVRTRASPAARGSRRRAHRSGGLGAVWLASSGTGTVTVVAVAGRCAPAR